MDRLPRDVASERLHHDIVRLLDEHVPRSPQMVNVIPNTSMMTSPTGQLQLQQPTVIVPKRQKSKRPSKNANNNNNNVSVDPTSPEMDLTNTGSIRRKASVKKTKKNTQHVEVPQSVDSITSTLSPVESPMTNLPSPYDTASIYSNMGLTPQGLESLMGSKQPPSYEDVVKNNPPMHNLVNLENYGAFTLGNFHDTMIMQQRQLQQANTLSPPYSNQSPPHSVQSNMSLSPQGYNGSPSPAKTRPSLPTSPTHIAAMRAATQQKHGGVPQAQNLQMGFDFSQTGLELPLAYPTGLLNNTNSTLQPQQFQQNYYLTPPSQHSDHLLPDNFPTPSPESPGHWSSSSPRSCNSDWSENVASPNTYSSSTGHQTNKGSDAIYI